MPRLLSRAVLVLGGATAATAAAWLISSATASADTLPPVVSPGTAAVMAAPAGSPVLTNNVIASSAGITKGISTAGSGNPGSGRATSTTSQASGVGDASKPFETGLSSVVSTVADPVTSAGSTAVDAVTEPSQHAVLALPASLPVVPSAGPAGLGQLTNGLRAAVGQLGDRLPVGRDLPTELVGHLGRGTISTPAVPAVPAQPTTVTGKYRPTVQAFPFAAGQHRKLGAGTGSEVGTHATGSLPLMPAAPGSSPFGPLAVPTMPGNGGGSGNGFAAPSGLATGDGSQLLPEPHVVDVFSPATELASVMPGKQPGVTPD
jgi:hypothetical protein